MLDEADGRGYPFRGGAVRVGREFGGTKRHDVYSHPRSSGFGSSFSVRLLLVVPHVPAVAWSSPMGDFQRIVASLSSCAGMDGKAVRALQPGLDTQIVGHAAPLELTPAAATAFDLPCDRCLLVGCPPDGESIIGTKRLGALLRASVEGEPPKVGHACHSVETISARGEGSTARLAPGSPIS